MALYRVITGVARGEKVIPPRTILKEGDLAPKTVTILLRKGVIAEVSPPPLQVLPGWKLRGSKLIKIGIVDAVQLVEGDATVVAKALHMTREGVVKWQQDAWNYLIVDPPRRR